MTQVIFTDIIEFILLAPLPNALSESGERRHTRHDVMCACCIITHTQHTSHRAHHLTCPTNVFFENNATRVYRRPFFFSNLKEANFTSQRGRSMGKGSAGGRTEEGRMGVGLCTICGMLSVPFRTHRGETRAGPNRIVNT